MKNIGRSIIGMMSLLPLLAAAQGAAYPNQPIKIIVPFTAGGVVDAITRTVGERLSAKLGQPVIIENRTGAGGGIGTQFVAKSTPDGYTLLSVSPGHVIGPHMVKNASWNPVQDFRAVQGFGVISNVFVVPSATTAKTMNELIALARKSPQPLTYATAGNGTSNHLSALLLEQTANVKLTHVPYRGQPEALADLLGGRVDMMPLTTALAKKHIDAGALRPLAVTTAARSSALPDTPTVAEAANLPGYEVSTWFGFVAPAKTPEAVINKLSTSISEVLAMPDVKVKLAALGMDLTPQSPKQFDQYIASENDKWTRVLKQAGVEPQ
jgi:tripartite-type tricarboxylate transporter receptor subunit TctC